MSTTSRFVSLAEAAKILGVTPTTVRNWAKKGLVGAIRLPSGRGHYRIDLEGLIDACRVVPKQPAAAKTRGRPKKVTVTAGPGVAGNPTITVAAPMPPPAQMDLESAVHAIVGRGQ